MRGVAIGFAVHSAAQILTIIDRAVAEHSWLPVRQLGDCLDEAWYAWLIWAASSHYAAISTSQGADLEHLMSGIHEMRRLWRKMQKPLFVKAAVMVLLFVWRFQPTKDVVRALLGHIGLRRARMAAAATGHDAEGGDPASAFATALALIDSVIAPLWGDG